jgi:uncharacterized membrane protein
MLRTTFTALITLVVAFVSSVAALQLEAAHAYDTLDDPWKALEYVTASLLLPFVASVAVAIAGMARGSQLNR